MNLAPYSIGIGDRFGHQGVAQLKALAMARDRGVELTPVWNKSNREHTLIGTTPADARRAADDAVRQSRWTAPHFVDADHIGLKNVEPFLPHCDFFTLDVADAVGVPPADSDLQAFVTRNRRFTGKVTVPGLAAPLDIGEETLCATGRKYLAAVKEAGRTYRRIEQARGAGAFVTEVSMDETSQPQSPGELLFILSAIAAERIPAATIAPKFSGRFNKGVDYVGDIRQFAREFEQDLCVIAFAVREFGLPADLKLSVHSGSDKFSLYPVMRPLLHKHNAGLHLKTAGTTWLEEMAGLAMAGGNGLQLAGRIYEQAFARFDEVCKPYATVLDINREKLPAPKTVQAWPADAFVKALRHDPSCRTYNAHFRQLVHVSFRIAAELKAEFIPALEAHEETIGGLVADNLFRNHIQPLFLGIEDCKLKVSETASCRATLR